MKLRAQNPPHIRSRESNQTVMVDVMIAMLPLYAMATYFYGIRALALGAFSAGVTFVFDVICTAMRRTVPNIRDYSAIVTGMLIPLLMPVSARFEAIVAASLFAMAVAKHPFGGVGQNIFNPAVAGVAFATVCWPKTMFSYPIPFATLPININESIKLVNSPAYTLSLGGAPSTDIMDMLLGNFPGPMGATNILVLSTCLLFLTVRKTVSFTTSASFIAGFSVIAAVMPRAMLSPIQSVCYELMSGLALIGAVFIISDPVTSPKRKVPKIVYGFLTGALCMLFRHIGKYEESLLFAILIMNAAVWIIDLWGEQVAHALRRKNFEHKTNQEIQEESDQNLGTDTE